MQESVALVSSCPLAWLSGKSLCVSTAVSVSWQVCSKLSIVEMGYSRLSRGCLLFCIWDQGLDRVGLQSVILWSLPPKCWNYWDNKLSQFLILLCHCFLLAPHTCIVLQYTRMCGKIVSAWFSHFHGLLVQCLAPFPLLQVALRLRARVM